MTKQTIQSLFCAFLILAGCGVASIANAQISEKEAIASFVTSDSTAFNTPYKPNAHQGAQWYPKAGLGMFLHWGIHSVAQMEPSWCMADNRFAARYPRSITPENYYKLSEQFKPQNYDPDQWMEFAKSLGMTYVVLTAKHHDGYCLWPTKYGEYNVANVEGGRDLVKEYVDAAHRHGLKVGLYFSPRDWAFNDHKSGFGMTVQKFDMANPKKLEWSQEENEALYYKWLDYSVGQLSELLTNYGQIDLLWFDGAHWLGAPSTANADGLRIRNWIYSLQPQILINPRWGGKNIDPDYKGKTVAKTLQKMSRAVGDFYTYEVHFDSIDQEHNDGVKEPAWFEYCDKWIGHWGYLPPKAGDDKKLQKKQQEVVYKLSVLRAFGGNYLINVGPDGDGQFRPDVVAAAAELSPWMLKHQSALVDVDPVKNWEDISSVPLTQKGTFIYAHCTAWKKAQEREVVLSLPHKPKSATIVESGVEIQGTYESGIYRFTLAPETYSKYGVVVQFDMGHAVNCAAFAQLPDSLTSS